MKKFVVTQEERTFITKVCANTKDYVTIHVVEKKGLLRRVDLGHIVVNREEGDDADCASVAVERAIARYEYHNNNR